MDRMGSEPNLSVKQSVTIGTLILFDSDFDGHGHGDGTCKQDLNPYSSVFIKVTKISIDLYFTINACNIS